MTFTAIHFVNGDAFFFGVAIIVLACAAKIILAHPAYQLLQRIGIAIGTILIGLSATPLPMWLYAIWAVFVLVVLLDRKSKPDDSPWRRYGAPILLLVFSLIAGLVEFPHHIKPNISIDHANKIIVVGDSISAGIGNESDLWPTILQNKFGIEVVNLSEPGAKVTDAAKTVSRLENEEKEDNILILEIGGNDILGKTEIDTFEMSLDRTFSHASDCSDTVIVLELPLPPFCNGYGTIQRKLASKYKAHMIPKRYFSGIIGRRDATVDGLHLSPIGHQLFADMMLEMLGVPKESR